MKVQTKFTVTANSNILFATPVLGLLAGATGQTTNDTMTGITAGGIRANITIIFDNITQISINGGVAQDLIVDQVWESENPTVFKSITPTANCSGVISIVIAG